MARGRAIIPTVAKSGTECLLLANKQALKAQGTNNCALLKHLKGEYKRAVKVY